MMKIGIQVMRVILGLSALYLAFVGDFNNMIVSGSAVLFTYVPELLKRVTGVVLPDAWRFVGVLFIFASQWLGTYLRAYDVLPWWDVMLHGFSGILIGLMGLIFVVLFDREQVLIQHQKYGLISFIVFLAASASASLWEMFEFIGDTFLGTNAQLGSLIDTMEDISICVIIGLVFSIMLYCSLRSKKENAFKRHIENFFRENHI